MGDGKARPSGNRSDPFGKSFGAGCMNPRPASCLVAGIPSLPFQQLEVCGTFGRRAATRWLRRRAHLCACTTDDSRPRGVAWDAQAPVRRTASQHLRWQRSLPGAALARTARSRRAGACETAPGRGRRDGFPDARRRRIEPSVSWRTLYCTPIDTV